MHWRCDFVEGISRKTFFRLKPDYVNAYYNRGVVEALLGRTRAAKQDYQTALRLAEKAGDASLKTDVEKALRLLE